MAAAVKKDTSASKASKKAPPTHPTYKDMIKDAILQLKDRSGSSRQALKKYIQSTHNISATNFESLLNAAIRRGVSTGDFVQPKGPSGPVKLQKKEAIKPAKKTVVKKVEKKVEKKPVVAKKTEKKPVAKKATSTPKRAVAKSTAIEKKPVVKKAATKKSVKPAATKVKSSDAKVKKAPVTKKKTTKTK